MFKKLNRLVLYITVCSPLLVLPYASAEQAIMPDATATITTTKTTAFDLSHSAMAGDALLIPLNINTASERELTALPGIGAYKAAKIIQWRNNHGEFITTKDLVNVKGIGNSTVAKLTDHITVSDL